MGTKWFRYFKLSLLSLLGFLLVWFASATPSYSHWADLSVAEIVVRETDTQITLTFPTDLVAFADDDKNNQLSPDEISTHQTELQNFLGDRIRITDSNGQSGTLNIQSSEITALPSNVNAPQDTHSTLSLGYTWLQPVEGIKINYKFFLPGVPTATCLATILHSGKVQNFVFSPTNQEFSLMPGSIWLSEGSFIFAIVGAFFWGAMHALSPGHGKTIVGAYLVGAHATPKHALFLGLTTTITHTTGVFLLGIATLFAAQFILPEQLYPWLSVLSGLMVVAIGLNLFLSRLHSTQKLKKASTEGEHSHHHHPHDHSHGDTHHHSHESHSHGSHSHGSHSHLPPGADGSPVSWRNLLLLGISGGLIPCPSALVVLLGAIGLGRISFGLVLVLAFSLGLAAVLTTLGLLLVYTKSLFNRLQTQIRFVRLLPAASALVIALIGVGITIQALWKIGLVSL